MLDKLKQLDNALLELHKSGKVKELSTLHQEAAELLDGDDFAVRFHLTHAYIFALEAGAWEDVTKIEPELVRLGGLRS